MGIFSNGSTVAIIEIQSSRSVDRQLTVGVLSHATKPENPFVVGISLTKTCLASIFVQTGETDGEYKLAEISILGGAHLLAAPDLRSFIYYFCEVIKVL